MTLGDSKAIKTGLWTSNEILHVDDINYLGESTYQNITDQMALKAYQTSVDEVISGLILIPDTLMACTLSTGEAVSFSGSYLTGSTWGFVAFSGKVFSIVLPEDTSVVISTADPTNPRVDVIEIRPIKTAYNSKARKYKDPITGIVTSSPTNTRYEYGYEVQVLEGTPAASPVADTKTAGWIKLAEVTVPALATTITSGNIKTFGESSTWTTESSITSLKNLETIETELQNNLDTVEDNLTPTFETISTTKTATLDSNNHTIYATTSSITITIPDSANDNAQVTVINTSSGDVILSGTGISKTVKSDVAIIFKWKNSTYEIVIDTTHIVNTTSNFTVTSAGWYTIFRTKKNFNGIFKLSAYADNLKDYITFSVYGHEDAGDHDITILEQSRKGNIAGITKARWGDAGAGNGLCLQLYIDKGSDASVIVNVEKITSNLAGIITNAEGFVFGPHTSVAQDYDGTTVSTFRTYYRAALSELIRSKPYRMACHPDVVVDGITVTRVEPGIYNSIHFTGGGAMGCGKYIVLGDFTLDSGYVIHIDEEPACSAPAPNLVGSAVASSRCWHGVSSMGNAAIKNTGRYGGGNGGWIGTSYPAGGAGPCACGGRTIHSAPGGGWVIVNCLGKVTLAGTFNANAVAPVTTGVGASGGAILFRQLEEGGMAGTFNANGSAGATTVYPGGGGGRVETYCFGSFTGSTSVAKGSTYGSPTDGKAYHINLINQPEMTAAGGSDIATADEYLNAGKIIKADGGWWF